MSGGGFIPLTSSMLSSEHDPSDSQMIRLRSFSITSPSPITITNRKAFITTPKDTPIQKRRSDMNADLERMLLKPVKVPKSATPMNFEELEDMLAGGHPISSGLEKSMGIHNTPSQCRSFQAPSSVNSVLDSIEGLLFSDDAPRSDPFLGFVETRTPSTKASLQFDNTFSQDKKTTKTQEFASLGSSKAATPAMLRVKILDKHPAPNPITPNFSKKIAIKAKESRNKACEERRTYTAFIKRLASFNKKPTDTSCNSLWNEFLNISHNGFNQGFKDNDNGEDNNNDDYVNDEEEGEEEEDDDDEIFDNRLNSTIESDDACEDGGSEEEAKSITKRELLELYSDEESVDSLFDMYSVDDKEKMAEFDSKTMQVIEQQLNIHFQLLVQSLALSGEIKDADQAWVTALKMMIRLSDDMEMTIALGNKITFLGKSGLVLLLRILQQSPLHVALIEKIKKTVNDPDLRLRASISSIPFKPKSFSKNLPVLSQSFWHVLSLFSETFNPLFTIVPKQQQQQLLQQLQLRQRQDQTNPNPQKLLDHRMTGIAPDLTFFQYRRTDSFLAIEDRLLLLGLKRHGLGNWEKIQANLLPTRTAKQLAIRYKNLTTRRAPPSAIKAFAEEVMKPLSQAEEELLTQGVKCYGDDWRSISNRFLPHRPPSILRRSWMRRKTKRSQGIISILNTHFPTDDEDDSDYIESSL